MTMEAEFPMDSINDADREMLLQELEEVGKARDSAKALFNSVTGKGGRDQQPYTIGLALSGGGIRSATVSLGVMQKLAGAGVLKHVDYLSTVSGGGYIGSALTWWLRRRRPDEPPSNFDTGAHFPFGTTDPKDPEPPEQSANAPLPLQYLRVQGNYLTPGNGITYWSGLAIVLRAIFLNLLIWIPATAFVVLLLLGIGRLPILKGLPFLVKMAAPGALETAANVTGSSESVDINQTIPPVFLLLLLVASALLVLFLLGSVNHSLLSWTGHTESQVSARAEQAPGRRKWYVWILVGIVGLIGFAILGGMAYWLLQVAGPLFAGHSGEHAPSFGVDLDLGLLVLAAFATALWTYFLGRRGHAEWLTGPNQRQLWFAVAGLAAIAIADLLLVRAIGRGHGADWWKRGSALLQFVFGMGFLAYANYLIGLLIRHLLRAEAIGGAAAVSAPGTTLLEYHARRLFEWFYGGALLWSLVLIAVGVLPLVSAYIDYRIGGAWTALGLAITAAGQWRARAAGHGRMTSILVMVGAGLFAYGILLIGYRLALTFLNGDATAQALIAALFAVAAISGWFVNTNHIGLHRYYRDRLMEAFMPDEATLAGDSNGPAHGANEFRLAEAWAGADSRGSYHIVNANMVLTNSKVRKYRLRGGDNFILSPYFIGSSATGWHKTSESEAADMTLASAMAISGAAANPRGGAGGKGLTRFPTVALAMNLLNVRLGYWVRNPRNGQSKSLVPRRPNHFWPGGTYALTRGGYREDCKWLELADGGHFENLAVYELVRRRCGLIIVCDGGQDNASSYSDLVTAVQRIGQDFGAAVRFDMYVGNTKEASGPAQLIAKKENTDYPKGAEFADKGYFVATIDYGPRGGKGWPNKGTLIYLKSTLIKDLDVRAKGYRGAHAEFPNQTTGDQFFDEEQFEAYREVGYRISAQMIKDLGLKELFGKDRPSLTQLRDNELFGPGPRPAPQGKGGVRKSAPA